MTVTITWRHLTGGRPAIWDELANELGREPTWGEAIAEVKRTIADAAAVGLASEAKRAILEDAVVFASKTMRMFPSDEYGFAKWKEAKAAFSEAYTALQQHMEEAKPSDSCGNPLASSSEI